MPFGAYQRISCSPLEARVQMNGQSPLGCLLLIVVPALLVVSTYLAWWELRFFVQGRTIEATVDRIEDIRLRNGLFGGSYRDVHYSFPDGDSNRVRSERDELPASWPRPARPCASNSSLCGRAARASPAIGTSGSRSFL